MPSKTELFEYASGKNTAVVNLIFRVPGKSWIFFLKFPGPGKSWKMNLALESRGIYSVSVVQFNQRAFCA